jgi:ribosomal-protein-alanine N-acetyltransferase
MSRVRRYQPDNAHALAESEAAATAYSWSTRNYQDSIATGHVFYRLEQETSGVAVVMLLLDEAELLNIFISVEQQGQGQGQRLLSGIMDDLKQQGCQRLFLEVRASNQPAIKLYQRCGFQQCGLRKNYYPSHDGTREHAILMEAQL